MFDVRHTAWCDSSRIGSNETRGLVLEAGGIAIIEAQNGLDTPTDNAVLTCYAGPVDSLTIGESVPFIPGLRDRYVFNFNSTIPSADVECPSLSSLSPSLSILSLSLPSLPFLPLSIFLVITASFKDANLYHDLATGRAVTGVLHFLSQTPIDWYTKKQETVVTATYSSEFVATRIPIQQIAALRIPLRYLGVEVHGPSYLFGDNESVVESTKVAV